MEQVTGVLKLHRNGSGSLRKLEKSLRRTGDDVQVPKGLVSRFKLCEGARVEGVLRQLGKQSVLGEVVSVCGVEPEAFRNRTRFEDLVAVDPEERFEVSLIGDMSLRVVDLVAPVGMGTRGLIVSPPKAGKTMLLEKLATAIHRTEPDCQLIVLLVDERPEEVTAFRRSAEGAQVLASSNDMSTSDHVELVELTMAHVRTEMECGHDVVVLADSLTRMGRAFNLEGGGSRKGGRGRGRRSRGPTMSGGMEAGALEIPRRFFGLARNIEGGGSISIIATCLVDTGSRMDQLIFEEFKGTGNSELVLDRKLAEMRLFPAVNITESGTRKEERLYEPEEYEKIVKLRRILVDMKPAEALESLLKKLEKHRTNEEFLKSLP